MHDAGGPWGRREHIFMSFDSSLSDSTRYNHQELSYTHVMTFKSIMYFSTLITQFSVYLGEAEYIFVLGMSFLIDINA
jgi:hypothetical protein